jgi:hypothetical protein
MDYVAFHQFLDLLYNSGESYFDLAHFVLPINKTNVVATAMAIELSDITGYIGIDRNQTLDFILSNRNEYGGFDMSNRITIHELLDTYEIITALDNSGDLGVFDLDDENDLIDYINMFKQYNHGYSLISEDYMSVDLVHTIISSYLLHDILPELEVQELYTLVYDCFRELVPGFTACTKLYPNYEGFRSKPIEYLSLGNRQLIEQISTVMNTKATFKILDIFRMTHKLDNFANNFDLGALLDYICSTQFLEVAYPQSYGAFLPFVPSLILEAYKNIVSVEESFYAIRSMELISDYLALGEIVSLNFDANALETYIFRNLMENTNEIYFSSPYSQSNITDMENTYYALYILDAIDKNSLETPKIYNFIANKIDYSNVKSIYYGYKISELLDLNFHFDVPQVQSLVQSLYSPAEKEFYLSESQEDISQDILLWISDMAVNDEIRVVANYSSEVPLGGYVSISASLNNLIFSDFGDYTSVRLESAQLGTIQLTKLPDGTFKNDIFIASTATNYPIVSGNISIFDGILRIHSIPFNFDTTYELQTNLSSVEYPTHIHIKVNASLLFETVIEAVLDGEVYINVYKNEIFLDTKNFQIYEHLDYTDFIFDYYPSTQGEYHLDVFMKDGINPTPQLVGTLTYICISPDHTGGFEYEFNASIPLIVFSIAVPGTSLLLTRRGLAKKIGKFKKNKTSPK